MTARVVATYNLSKNRNSPGDPTILAGTPAAGAPLWSGTASLTFDTPLTNAVNLVVEPAVEFRPHVNMREFARGPFSCQSTTIAFGPSCFYALLDGAKLNLRVALEHESGWQVALQASMRR